MDKIAQIGVMGFIAVAVVVTVCALAAFSVIRGIDNANTTALVTVVSTAAGAVLAAAGKFFGGDSATK